jgi:hypothetical protein
MFSRRKDASKIALTWLIARLNYGGFRLFDTQFVTEHLETLGAVELPRRDYRDLLPARSRRQRISRDAAGPVGSGRAGASQHPDVVTRMLQRAERGDDATIHPSKSVLPPVSSTRICA